MTMTDEYERRQLAELFREDDRLRAEHEEWLARRQAAQQPPEPASFVKREASTTLYRVIDNNALPPAAESAADEGWEGWEKWLRGHLGLEREEMSAAVAALVVELRKEWRAEREIALVERDRKIGMIEGELCETKAILGDVLTKLSAATSEIEQLRTERRERQIRDQTIIERSSRVAELQRENAASRAALERQRSEQALAERDARIDRLETQLGMLLRYIGGDLPRGWGTR
jgi:hypothetical protein